MNGESVGLEMYERARRCWWSLVNACILEQLSSTGVTTMIRTRENLVFLFSSPMIWCWCCFFPTSYSFLWYVRAHALAMPYDRIYFSSSASHMLAIHITQAKSVATTGRRHHHHFFSSFSVRQRLGNVLLISMKTRWGSKAKKKTKYGRQYRREN